jgi:hypothetical protein
VRLIADDEQGRDLGRALVPIRGADQRFLRSRSCWRGSPLTFALIGSLGYPAFAPRDTSPVRGLLQQVRGVDIGDHTRSEQLQRLPEL